MASKRVVAGLIGFLTVFSFVFYWSLLNHTETLLLKEKLLTKENNILELSTFRDKLLEDLEESNKKIADLQLHVKVIEENRSKLQKDLDDLKSLNHELISKLNVAEAKQGLPITLLPPPPPPPAPKEALPLARIPIYESTRILNKEEEKQMDFETTWRLGKMSWEPCARFECLKDEDVCKDHTAPADFEAAHPPCCIHLLRDLLFDVIDWLEKYDVEYFIHYGTLLGAVRDGTIIPWTADVDIALNVNDLDALIRRKDMKREMWDKGYVYFHENEMGRLCFSSSYKGGVLNRFPKPIRGTFYYDYYPYMDIYAIKGNNRIHTPKGPCSWDKQLVYPLKRIQLYDRMVKAPARSEQLLENTYGNWRSYRKNLHGVHQCTG